MESEHSLSGDSSSGSGCSESSSDSEEEERIEPIRVLDCNLELPQGLCENVSIFKEFFSMETWNSLSDVQKDHLKRFLPDFPVNNDEEKEKTVQGLLDRNKFKFTSPLMDFHNNLKVGNYRPDIAKMRKHLQRTQEKQTKEKMQKYYAHLMLDVVLERERLLVAAKGLPPGTLPKLPPMKQNSRKCQLTPQERTKIRYFQELEAIRAEINTAEAASEDDNYPEENIVIKGNKQRRPLSFQNDTAYSDMLLPLTTDNVYIALARHRARRNRRESHPELNTTGITLQDIKQRVGIYNGTKKPNVKLKRKRNNVKSIKRNESQSVEIMVKIKSEKGSDTDTLIDPTSESPIAKKRFRSNSMQVNDIGREFADTVSPRHIVERKSSLQLTPVKDDPDKLDTSFNQNIKLEDLDNIDMSLPVQVMDSQEPQTPEEPSLDTQTQASFFSLVRGLFPARQAHRATLPFLRKKLAAMLSSPIAPLNSWYNLSSDWNSELSSALAFLAGEKGPHPDDYVPYLQFVPETEMYQWIGAGRDCDSLLGRLCERWLKSKRSPVKQEPNAPNSAPTTPTPPKVEPKRPPITIKETSRLKKTFQKLQKEFKKSISVKDKESVKPKIAKKPQLPQKEVAKPVQKDLPQNFEQCLDAIIGGTKKDEKSGQKEQLSFASYTEQIPFSVNTNINVTSNLTGVVKHTSSDSGSEKKVPLVKTKIVEGKPIKSAKPKVPSGKVAQRKPSKEVQEFREAEAIRFSRTHLSYTYSTKHGNVVVPPLQYGCLSKLNIDGYENVVTDEIAAKLVVCDALARTQPKGATQHQLVQLIKMSQFVKKSVDMTLLTYCLKILEQMRSDHSAPIVSHDTRTKLWTYLLRDKTEQELLMPRRDMNTTENEQPVQMEEGCAEEIIDNNATSDSEVDVENTSESSPPILHPKEQQVKMTFINNEMFGQSEEANQEYAVSCESRIPQPQVVHQTAEMKPIAQNYMQQKANIIQKITQESGKNVAKQIILQPMTLQGHPIIQSRQSSVVQASVPTIAQQRSNFVQGSVQQIVPASGQRVLKVVQSTQPTVQSQIQFLNRSPIIVAAPKTKTIQTKSNKVFSQMIDGKMEASQVEHGNKLILQSGSNQAAQPHITLQGKRIIPTQQLLIKTSGQGQKVQPIPLATQKIIQQPAKNLANVGQQVLKQNPQTVKTVTIQKPSSPGVILAAGNQKVSVAHSQGQQIQMSQARVQTIQTVNTSTGQIKTQAARSLLLRPQAPSSGDNSPITSVISNAQGRRGVVRVLSAASPASGKSLISPRALTQQANQVGMKKQTPTSLIQTSASSTTILANEGNRPKTVQLLQTTGQRRTIQLASQSVQLSSGQTVQLASGQNLQAIQLGQTVQIGGQNMQLGGQTVQLAGQRLQLGGQTVQLASGQSVQLSGQTVQLASGQSVQLTSPVRTQMGQQNQQIMAKLITNQQGQLMSVDGGRSIQITTSNAQNKNQLEQVIVSSAANMNKGQQQVLLTHKNLVLQQSDGQHTLLLGNIGGSHQLVRTTSSSSSPIIKLQQVSSLQHLKLAQGIKLQQGGTSSNMVTLTAPQLKLLGAPGHILARILPTANQSKPPSNEPS